MNDELMHYGVLGMKWGVRRFQPYPSSYRGNRKEIGEAKKRSKIGYDDDIIIKKGTKAYRITKDTNENSERRYMTVDQNDRNFYKAMWPGVMKGEAGTAGKKEKIYESTYRLKKDLISPSAAKRQKWAAELTDQSEVQMEIARALVKSRLSKSKNMSLKDTEQMMTYFELKNDPFYKAYMNRTTKEVKTELSMMDEAGKATMFLGSMGLSDHNKAIYGEKIVNENYNMVIDDHGTDFPGNKQRVNSPIIVLKANETIEKIKDKPLRDFDDARAARKYRKDISSIPGSFSEKNYVPNVIKKYYGTNNYNHNPTFDYIYDSNNQRIR